MHEPNRQLVLDQNGQHVFFNDEHLAQLGDLKVPRLIPNDCRITGLPLWKNQRVMLLRSAQDWPRWSAQRLFAKAKARMELVRKLNRTETQKVLEQIKRTKGRVQRLSHR
jgi:hypothetical protein